MKVRTLSQSETEEKLKRGEWQIHKFPLGFLITEIKQYRDERILTVQLVSGERLDEWKQEAHKRLRAFAVEHQCKAIEALCRLGLEKKLAPLGYRKTRVLLRAEI